MYKNYIRRMLIIELFIRKIKGDIIIVKKIRNRKAHDL